MSKYIYIYDLLAQDGASPVCSLRTDSPPVGTPASTLGNPSATRQADPLSEQSLRLVERLLRPVSPVRRKNMGLFMGTRFGCLEDDRIFQNSRLADGGKYASPAAFRRTLPSTVPAELSIAFAIRGPLVVFAEQAAPAQRAILHALRWINSGRIDCAMAGSFDFFSPGPVANTTASEGSMCRILACLIGTGNTSPGLMPWAVITQAAIEAAGEALLCAEKGNLEPLRKAMKADTISPR